MILPLSLTYQQDYAIFDLSHNKVNLIDKLLLLFESHDLFSKLNYNETYP